jgi:hypothetical protein
MGKIHATIQVPDNLNTTFASTIAVTATTTSSFPELTIEDDPFFRIEPLPFQHHPRKELKKKRSRAAA